MQDHWNQQLRAFRHSPCLMTPLSTIMLVLLSALMLLSLILRLPGLVIGMFLAPIARRSFWFVEFLYPFSISRWGHILLLRLGAKSRNSRITVSTNDGTVLKSVPLHSRSVEQRVEVVKGQVYIHCLPQLLDNIAYLIVCVPPDFEKNSPMSISCDKKYENGNKLGKSSQKSLSYPAPIVAILIDCGDAESVKDQIMIIQKLHYPSFEIQVHMILSTHKHHDHTAGIYAFKSDKKWNKNLQFICGGAVEKVPYCNRFVTNGELLPMPSSGSNINMSRLVEVECIAVPSHTRGSIVYALRNKVPFASSSASFTTVTYLFTGDAMFSGGGGVPFEADLEFPQDRDLNQKNIYSLFKPSSGGYSVERCFVEIFARGTRRRLENLKPSSKIRSSSSSILSTTIQKSDLIHEPDTKPILIFPGHEYTVTLLQRQLDQGMISPEPLGNNQWSKLEPSFFFEVATQFFIANHKRSLPKSTRLLTVPSTIEKELKINPTFRVLRKRGEQLITAIDLWHTYYGSKKSNTKSKNSKDAGLKSRSKAQHSARSFGDLSEKSLSSGNTWNQDYHDYTRSIFSTMYTSDLDYVIEGLKDGTLNASRAAKKLSELSSKLDNHVMTRRPIPDTLPNDKIMYLGLIALAVFGSYPSAMTYHDSVSMNLAEPVSSSDHLLISKSRLIYTLRLFELISCESDDYHSIIDSLWSVAQRDFYPEKTKRKQQDTESSRVEKNRPSTYDSLDVEQPNGTDELANDFIELGLLKLTLYSVPYGQKNWFKKSCLPCGSDPETDDVNRNKMTRSGGELIRHDLDSCPVCGFAGCSDCICEESEDTDSLLLLDENNTVEKNSGNVLTPVKQSGDDSIEIVMQKNRAKNY